MHRIHGQFGVILIAAAVGTLFPAFFPGAPIAASEWTTLFRWHLLAAIAAYSFMMIALVHAVLMALQNRYLKASVEQPKFLDSMPGLVVMERIFFRIVAVGFLFMTAVLVLGGFATEEAYGVFFRFDHKMILTWIAWVLFGILLAGRRFAGWRAKTALRWFWAGFLVFVIAYLGYSFILEVFNAATLSAPAAIVWAASSSFSFSSSSWPSPGRSRAAATASPTRSALSLKRSERRRRRAASAAPRRSASRWKSASTAASSFRAEKLFALAAMFIAPSDAAMRPSVSKGHCGCARD